MVFLSEVICLEHSILMKALITSSVFNLTQTFLKFGWFCKPCPRNGLQQWPKAIAITWWTRAKNPNFVNSKKGNLRQLVLSTQNTPILSFFRFWETFCQWVWTEQPWTISNLKKKPQFCFIFKGLLNKHQLIFSSWVQWSRLINLHLQQWKKTSVNTASHFLKVACWKLLNKLCFQQLYCLINGWREWSLQYYSSKFIDPLPG